MARKPRKSTALASPGSRDEAPSVPGKAEILAYIESAPDKVGKREIARAFGIRGGDRIALKQVLREMADEGLIHGNRKRIERPGALPPVTILEIIGRDEHGEFFAHPEKWDVDENGAPPRILIETDTGRPGNAETAGVGDRVLARISAAAQEQAEDYQYQAGIIKRLPRAVRPMLGIYRASEHGGGRIDPIDRRQLRGWMVAKGDEGEANDGDLVRFTVRRGPRDALSGARIKQSLGNPDASNQISLIALHAHGIPEDFPGDALAELEQLPDPDNDKRRDLRGIALLTIDPPDARDHDDAVWAEADKAGNNKGGWIVWVAIADVATYVRPGTALDRAARERGNSIYFPDRVVPMLPEQISNDLCSLKLGEDRPCLAVQMTFNASGEKIAHSFERAVMRSACKLSYIEAQSVFDGKATTEIAPPVGDALKALYGAYQALTAAREDRQPLDLDIPERKIKLDDDGAIAEIHVPARLDAHRLIEEFMIQANVATAETLESKRAPFIYRVHDAPTKAKLVALRDFLSTLDINLAKAGVLKPDQFNRVLARVRGKDIDQLVNEVILRAQSQAQYNPQNAGHFGLNLRRYAHFTSPIRRYADLVVHRALIRALGLGDDGLADQEIGWLAETAELISATERRAMAAERETTDRLIAQYLAGSMGKEFPGRISGVTRHGLFVRLDDTGADGFVPAATIGDDYFAYDEGRHMLIGKQSGEHYVLGDRVSVRLVEVIPTAGALRFEILTKGRRGNSLRGKVKTRSGGRRSGGKYKGGRGRSRR